VVRGSDSPPSAARCFCGRLISLDVRSILHKPELLQRNMCTAVYSEPILIFRADPRSGRAILQGSQHTTLSPQDSCARLRSTPGRQWASARGSGCQLERRDSKTGSLPIERAAEGLRSPVNRTANFLTLEKSRRQQHERSQACSPGRTSPLDRSNLMRRSGHSWC
jgi:hypothetical protein